LRKQIEGLYSPNPVNRVNAAFQIGKMAEKGVPAIPFLIAMLGDSTPLELCVINAEPTSPGREAAATLVKIGIPSVEPLVGALNHNEPRVRERAAWALSKLKDPRAVEPLIGALRDESSIVRRHAAHALREITGENFDEDPLRWQNWLDERKLRRCLWLKLFLETLRASKNR